MVLKQAHDPVGPENDYWLRELIGVADTIIAAWGNGAAGSDRATQVVSTLKPLYCLGHTLLGHPRHPLYLLGSTELVPLSC